LGGSDTREALHLIARHARELTGAGFVDHVTQNVDGLLSDLTKGLGIEFGPALALPLGAGDPPAGVLLTLRRPGSAPFDELEQQMVSLFANQAMLALERAKSRRPAASLNCSPIATASRVTCTITSSGDSSRWDWRWRAPSSWSRRRR
jgi:GAF domain-containing protein